MQPKHPEMLTPADKMAAGILLTDVEFAALADIALQTVRNWRWRGVGPRYVKLGNRLVRYNPADVRAYFDNNTVGKP